MKKHKIVIILLVIVIAASISVTAHARGYENIRQTQDEEVIAITEMVGEKYNICPELLQAIIFYESSNNANASNSGCFGYMQVSQRWHQERMERLGVDNLNDGYGNILVGTDYLMELASKYKDVGYVLMVYNGDSRAKENYEAGKLSVYADNILKLSAHLEQHRK